MGFGGVVVDVQNPRDRRGGVIESGEEDISKSHLPEMGVIVARGDGGFPVGVIKMESYIENFRYRWYGVR